MWQGLLIGFVAGGLLMQDFGAAVASAIVGAILQKLLNETRENKAQLRDIERRLSSGVELPTAARNIPPAEKIVSAPLVPPAVAETPIPVEAAKPAAPLRTREPPAPSKPARQARQREQPAPPKPRSPPAEPSALQRFIQRWVIGGNPLVKVGVLILFIGVGFLLRYAAERAVFPIELRYIGVAALGIALLLFGWRWRERKDSYGLTMQGAGIGILYLTTLAALKLHPILPVPLGFAILVGVAALAAYLAVKQDALILAVVAALCGFAAPVFASTGSGNHIALFSYLTILNLGIVAIAWFKSWRVLNLIGYVGSFGLGSIWAAKYYRDELFSTTEPFLLLLFALYVLVTFLFARRRLADDDKKLGYVDGTLAFGVPFSAFWVQHILVEPFQYGASISAVGFGAFYFLLSFLLSNRTGKRYSLLTETLTALGVVFCTIAIPLLQTSWTAAAWGAEAAGVYWIGTRQKQVLARSFALLLLLGSVFYFLPELAWSPGGSVLDGSVLSSALLAVGTGFTYWLMWRATAEQLHRYEVMLRPAIAGFGAFFLATIPLLLFSREWAAPALAIMGAGLIYASVRISDRPLMISGWIYQMLGGVLFFSTLKLQSGGIILASGWSGLLATSLIGAAMLYGFWTASLHDEDRPESDLMQNSALLVGLSFINLAPTFVMSWRFAAMIWPLIGIATLIWAIRTRKLGVIVFSIALQVLAGLAHLWSRVAISDDLILASNLPAFLNSGFIGPIVIALAAMLGAWFVQRDAEQKSSQNQLGWVALGWGGVWWSFSWLTEITRVVDHSNVITCLIAVTLGTAFISNTVARHLSWKQLGHAILIYVPILFVLALVGNQHYNSHPLDAWGALAWPAALLAHAYLLRQNQSANSFPVKFAHVVGAWLFIMQALIEIVWWSEKWSVAGSAWSLLGSVLVPALFVYAMSRDAITSRWPVNAHRKEYTLTSAAPLVVILIVWIWFTSWSHNGSASPLPYIPILNPMEIAFLMILIGTISWWHSIRDDKELADVAPVFNWLIRGTAFVVLTGGVIRACHHYANIPWDGSQLFESNVVQTSLSIVWGIVAISMMLLGNRRQKRIIWFTGASLIGIVVIKLFLVELSASGSLERIVSFIVVGLLLLFVGYVAPLPPRQPKPEETSAETS